MKIKKLITRMLFNKRQREIIWKALIYSSYKYRQRGRVDEAVAVQMVMDEVAVKLGIIPQTFTKEQVDQLVTDIKRNHYNDIKAALDKGYADGVTDTERFYRFNANKNEVTLSEPTPSKGEEPLEEVNENDMMTEKS